MDSSRKSTILVTGGTGYIGTHTIVELIQNLYAGKLTLNTSECNVLLVDNLSNSSEKILDRVNLIIDPIAPENKKGKHFEFRKLDVLDLPSLETLFAEYKDKNEKIDYIIHFAAKKAVGESTEKPLLYFENNFVGTLNLLKCMEKFECKNFIFSSSATVYGANNYCKEGDPMSFSNPYGATKVCVEHILDATTRCKSDWNVISLRYFNPCGAHESNLIGELPSGFPNNLFPFIEDIVKGKRECLNIFGNDYPTKDGTGVRDYLHVVDLAKAHVSALNKLKDCQGYQIYNIGTGVGYSVLDIVTTYSKVSNIEIPYKIVGRRNGDVDSVCGCPDRANKELGWKAEKNLEDMCRDSYNWVSKNPNGI